MSLKLALALRGHWAIAEEAAYHYHNAIVSKTLSSELDGDDPTPPILINPDESDPDENDTLNDTPPEDVQNIAMIFINGPIMQYGGACSYGATDYARMIRQYADDPSVCAVWLEMDTPGGQVYGTQTWAEAVQYCAEIKPVIGFCEDGIVASAGVWGWSFCTERYMGNSLCQTGSVGVMATYLDFSKAMEKNGITQLVIRAPQSKNKNKDFEDAFNGKPEAIEAELEFMCSLFINTITENLNPTGEDWDTGQMFFAEEAQKIGLINGIMTRSEVMQRTLELVSNNPQNKNQMFGNKIPALSALVGAAAGSITAAQVEAVNEQILKANIPGVTLCLDSELETNVQATANIPNLEATISQNATMINDLKSQIISKDAEIAALKLKVKTIPAAESTDAPAGNDAPPAGDEKIKASIETQTDRDARALRNAFKPL